MSNSENKKINITLNSFYDSNGKKLFALGVEMLLYSAVKLDSNPGFVVKIYRMQQLCFYSGFCRLWHFDRIIEWEGLSKGTAKDRIQIDERSTQNKNERAFVVIGIMSFSVECGANPKSK